MVEDIVAAARELRDKGLTFWHGPEWMGERFKDPCDEDELRGQCGSLAFYIHDPEGNAIEVMQYTKDSLQAIHDHD
jgi:catechol 2,3-dioxygenase-like lactoylglutathione lyase family enzyme